MLVIIRMKRNRTRQRKSKKGGARVKATTRMSTNGKAPRKTLTTAAAVKMNENNGNNGNNKHNENTGKAPRMSLTPRAAVKMNGNNGNNKRNENSGTNEKDLRIKELEEKLNTIHDMSRL